MNTMTNGSWHIKSVSSNICALPLSIGMNPSFQLSGVLSFKSVFQGWLFDSLRPEAGSVKHGCSFLCLLHHCVVR